MLSINFTRGVAETDCQGSERFLPARIRAARVSADGNFTGSKYA